MPETVGRRAPSARDRLIQAASRLFYTEGVNRVGVERIIATAGVARMTFYRHFPSKNDLIETVLEERAAALAAWLIDQTDRRSRSPGDRLLEIFNVLELHLAAAEYRGCAALNFVSELAGTAPRVTAIARQHKETVRRYLESNAKAAGVADPADLSQSLMLLMNGALSLGQLHGSVEPARQARRTAATLIAHAADGCYERESA